MVRQPIVEFKDEYRFLSNFYPHCMWFEEMSFPTSEHAYQAMKTLDKRKRMSIAFAPTPGKAKRMGNKLELRSDWEEVKLSIMERILIEKFSDTRLKRMLLATQDAHLTEGNYWGDTFWGVCRGVGENHLGKLLMKVREFYKLEQT